MCLQSTAERLLRDSMTRTKIPVPKHSIYAATSSVTVTMTTTSSTTSSVQHTVVSGHKAKTTVTVDATVTTPRSAKSLGGHKHSGGSRFQPYATRRQSQNIKLRDMIKPASVPVPTPKRQRDAIAIAIAMTDSALTHKKAKIAAVQATVTTTKSAPMPSPVSSMSAPVPFTDVPAVLRKRQHDATSMEVNMPTVKKVKKTTDWMATTVPSATPMVTVKSQTKVALKSTTPSLRSSTSAMRKKNRTPRRPRPTRLTGTARQHHIQTPSKVKGSTRKIDFHELMRFHNRYVNEDVSPIANTPPTASLKSVSAANEPAQYETKVAKVAIQDTTNYLEAANIDTLSATSYKLNQVVNDNKQFKTPASDLIPIPNPVAPDDIELPMAWSEMSQRSRERFKRALAAIRNRYRCRCQPNGREHQRGRNQDAAKHPVGSIQCRLHRRVADAALMTSDEIFFQSFGPPEQLLQVQNPFSRENMPEVALRLAAIDAETEAEATALRPVVKSQLPTPTHWTHSSISSRSKRVSVLTKSSTARTNTSAAVATRVGQTPFIKGAKLTPTKVNSSVSAPSVTTPKTTTVTTGFEAVKTLSITKKAIKTNIRQVTTKKAIVRPSAVATIKPSQADRMLLQQTKTLTNRSLLLDMEIAKVLRKTMVHSKQVMALEQTM
ncbi:hypothetical protein Poli38472_002761 [Pythium oligandrum]|uniref:Uncharacterized protein n=1 Tax=Pythium oligandrum TaxID=41045 RepID=A0A8K1CIG0_PYTOL|nr:hypothetical protein Poli38472_002761 [Pythium oligandrum]|eukprot:TMW63820.1 hypothetical protein Poli38472_002761 [Pythium oligandrum]